MLNDEMTVLDLACGPLVSRQLGNALKVSYFKTVGELKAASDEVLMRNEDMSGIELKELRSLL